MQELTPLTGYLATAAAVLPPQDPWRTQMDTVRSEWRAKLMDPAARSAADFRQKINRALSKVKDDYRTAYFNLHKKARLGVNEDGKKKELLKDPRLESLKKLAGVSLLPHSSLTELQTRLAKVQPCFTLVKDDLNASPICPHCNFRPQEENLGASGVAVLQQIDQQLDALAGELDARRCWRTWTIPRPRRASSCLPEEQKEAVNAFLKAKTLPEKISNDLVQGMQAGAVGLDRHPGPASRTARRPERQRRSFHGRANSDPVREVLAEDHPWQGASRRSVWSSSVARHSWRASSDHAPVHTPGLARPGVGRPHLRPPQQERLLHGAAAYPGRSRRRPGGQGCGLASRRTQGWQPPCSRDPIAFSPRGYTITHNDPLEFRQLPSVKEEIPPYSVCPSPYRWLREENFRSICEDEKLDIRESDTKDKESGWVFEPDRQIELLQQLLGKAGEETSRSSSSTATTATRSMRA